MTTPLPGTPGPAPANRLSSALLPANVRAAAITVGTFALVLAAVQVVNVLTDDSLVRYGIQPRSVQGLLGVLTAPLIHASWSHLLANLVPVLVLGFLVMVGSVRQFVAVTVLVWLLSGLGVWLVAPSNTDTVGASGLVFGWLAYLVARGVFTRSWKHILLGLVLLAVYGSVFWTGIVTIAVRDISGVVTVSWQAHLFGALAGVLAGFLVAKADGPRRRAVAG